MTGSLFSIRIKEKFEWMETQKFSTHMVRWSQNYCIYWKGDVQAFFDNQGVVYSQVMPKDSTINSVVYCDTLKKNRKRRLKVDNGGNLRKELCTSITTEFHIRRTSRMIFSKNSNVKCDIFSTALVRLCHLVFFKYEKRTSEGPASLRRRYKKFHKRVVLSN